MGTRHAYGAQIYTWATHTHTLRVNTLLKKGHTESKEVVNLDFQCGAGFQAFVGYDEHGIPATLFSVFNYLHC